LAGVQGKKRTPTLLTPFIYGTEKRGKAERYAFAEKKGKKVNSSPPTRKERV